MPNEPWSTTSFALKTRGSEHVCMRMRDHFSPERVLILLVCYVSAIAFLAFGLLAHASWSAMFGCTMGALGIDVERVGWRNAAKRYARSLATVVNAKRE